MKVLNPEVKDLLDIYVRPNIKASDLADYFMKAYPEEFKEYNKKIDSLRKIIDNYKAKYKEKIYVDKTDDKKIGELDFDEAIDKIKGLQAVYEKSSWSQLAGEIKLKTNADYIILMDLADTHFGSLGTDYDIFQAYADLLVNTPNLFAAMLGDGGDNFVAFKNMSAILQQVINPKLQYRLLELWLQKVAHKILFSTWSNHAEFEERVSGNNKEEDLLNHHTLYLNGMGKIKLWVNDIDYNIGATHKTTYNSKVNPLHGLLQMFRNQIRHADILMTADKHTPNIGTFTIGEDTVHCVMAGTLKKNDTYSARYHDSFTQTTMPCIVLGAKTKEITLFMNVRQALRYAGVDADKTLIERVKERSK
jgi:hypothetical protein